MIRLKEPEHNQTAPIAKTTSLFSNRYFVASVLVVILLFTAAVRFRLRDVPLERDEGEYAYSGQLILQGIPPYKLAYNMKFPGMYMAYAAIMSVFGQTSTGIHLGFTLVNAAGILLVYFLTKRIANTAAALVAAALYAYCSLSGAFVGIWAHATHFVVLFALPALLLLLRDNGRGKFGSIFMAGVLLGTSVLMKQHGAFYVAFAGCYMIYIYASAREWKKFTLAVALFSAGVWIPLLATGFWLWKAGVFAKFYFWTFQYAQTYAGQFGGWKELSRSLTLFTPNAIWISLGFVLPALMILWRRHDRPKAVFATGLFAASLLATVPGFKFSWHYFILPLPALSMLVGIVIDEVSKRYQLSRGDSYARLPFIAFGVALLFAIFSERQLFFECRPDEAPRLVYGPGSPFDESRRISDYLSKHVSPKDQIAVIGSEPQIYFYTRLHSATGYIYTYALMEPQPYASRMQKEMISEVENSKPKYIVYVDLNSSWIFRHRSDLTIFHWSKKYTADYEVVGAVETDDNKVAYYWDQQAPKHLSSSQIVVYKRKSPPTDTRQASN